MGLLFHVGETWGRRARQAVSLSKMRMHEPGFLAFSVIIGVVAAFGAMAFRLMIEGFQDLFWPAGDHFLHMYSQAPWWLALLIPTAGGLLAGVIIQNWAPEARGPGVTEVIKAVSRNESIFRARVIALKALVTSLLLGAGASVGREGPIVQIGGAAGSSLAQIFQLPAALRRVCLASGAAAGIAATFNAPIAGTLFAVEIILLDIEISHISHIVVSAVTASVLSRFFWGDFPTFSMPPFVVQDHWEFALYLLLGLLAGLVAITFVRLMSLVDDLFERLPLQQWIKPGIGGLGLGLMGLALPEVMGVGYRSINLALSGSLDLQLALLVLGGKLAATSLCIGSGMSGGIFAPSLVLGACLGSVVGMAAAALYPELGIDPGDYALIGMGAVVAGATLAPITAVLTIFELTYSQAIILPLMLSCITSTMLVRRLFGYSAYERRLLKQGVNIIRGHDVSVLQSLRVSELMDEEFESLSQSAPLLEVVQRVIDSPFPHFPVFTAKGELAGMLSLRDLKDSLDLLEELAGVVVAADLMTARPLTLTDEDNLETALRIFEEHHISVLPVTDAVNTKHVLGILKKDDFLRAYRERVLKDRILSRPDE